MLVRCPGCKSVHADPEPEFTCPNCAQRLSWQSPAQNDAQLDVAVGGDDALPNDPAGSQVADLLPLLTSLPPQAQALDLSLESNAQILRALDPHDLLTDALIHALVSCIRANPTRALVGQLPGLRAWPDELISPLLSSTRARGIAAAQQIVTVADLGEYTPARLLDLRQAGEHTVDDFIHAALTVAMFGPPAARGRPIDVGTEHTDLIVDPSAPAALEALATLRTVAAWGAERGITALGALWELDAEHMPPDVAAGWAELAELKPAAIADAAVAAASCGELVAELLTSLPEQRRAIFQQRVLKLERPTLAELGTELGVTRARIGQIQDRAIADIRARLAEDRFAPLRWRAHALRISLGAAAPYGAEPTAEVIDRYVDDVSHDVRDTTAELLLWLAGPYQLREGWLERDSVVPARQNALAVLADSDGLIDLSAAHEWLSERGIREAFHELWLDRFGQCRRLGERLAVWSGSVVDKCVTLLAVRGDPATAEELIEAVGEGHSARGARARFFEDPRLVRVNRTQWALRTWEREEYTGIADEIAQRITETGGRARLVDVVDALTSQFGVAAASVRVYAEAPRFVLEEGWVKLRSADEPYVVTATVAATRGVYVTGPERMSLLVPVDSEVLRGSGRSCPQVVAAALGVAPDGRRSLAWSGGSLLFTWPVGAAFGPALGSVRELAGSVGAQEGDLLRLDLDIAGGTVSAHRVPPDTSGLPPLARLSLQTGLDVAADTALAQLADALHVSSGEVRRCLNDRGDAAVAALLPRAELDDALADALGELERSFGGAD